MTSCSTLSDRVSAARFSLSRGKTQRAAGFSLVEVVLAIGVVAIAFVALLGLLPTGLTTYRKAMDISVGAQIFQKVIDDARTTDFATLVDDKDTNYLSAPGSTASIEFRAPGPGHELLRYFDETGSEVINPSLKFGGPDGAQLLPDQKAAVLYYVNTRIEAPTILPTNTSSAGMGQANRYLATVTVQVASNPGNLPMKFVSTQSDPNYLLYDTANNSMKGVVVTTFTGYVSFSN
jgi:type II secretory pathway pseudopilin PulG